MSLVSKSLAFCWGVKHFFCAMLETISSFSTSGGYFFWLSSVLWLEISTTTLWNKKPTKCAPRIVIYGVIWGPYKCPKTNRNKWSSGPLVITGDEAHLVPFPLVLSIFWRVTWQNLGRFWWWMFHVTPCKIHQPQEKRRMLHPSFYHIPPFRMVLKNQNERDIHD